MGRTWRKAASVVTSTKCELESHKRDRRAVKLLHKKLKHKVSQDDSSRIDFAAYRDA
jgi:hypothetical protein